MVTGLDDKRQVDMNRPETVLPLKFVHDFRGPLDTTDLASHASQQH